MLVPITYYKCNICGKTDNTERPGLLERLKSMFVTLPRGPFYVPIPSFCDACFHKRFPRGLDEANAVAQDYLDRIRSDANLYDEYKSKLYAIVDVAINRFLEQYAPIDCDKNLLKMICLKHGGGAQLVQDRKRAFSKKVLALIDYSKVDALVAEHMEKRNIIAEDIEKYFLTIKDELIPWHHRYECKDKATGNTLVFYHISNIRHHDEGRYNANWYVIGDGTTQIIYDYISNNREFFAGITKKLHDAIKATGGYPQSPQNQDVCHYRKGKQ